MSGRSFLGNPSKSRTPANILIIIFFVHAVRDGVVKDSACSIYGTDSPTSRGVFCLPDNNNDET